MYSGAARELARTLNDDLWVVLGILEVLAGRADLSREGRALAEAGLVAAVQAAERVNALQQMPSSPALIGHQYSVRDGLRCIGNSQYSADRAG